MTTDKPKIDTAMQFLVQRTGGDTVMIAELLQQCDRKDQVIAEKDQIIAERDARIAELEAALSGAASAQ